MTSVGSIKRRLIAMHLAAVLVVAAALPLTLYWRVDATARALHNGAMLRQAHELAGHLHRNPAGGWQFDLPPGLRQLYSVNYDRYGFVILTGSGQALFSGLGTEAAPFASAPRRDEPRTFERHLGRERLFGASVPVLVDGERLWVQVWEDEAHSDVLIDDIVADTLPGSAWVIVPILLALLLIDLAIFRNALWPLEAASRRARQIGPANIDLRLPEAGMPREVVPLVSAVNEALDRLQRGFQSQREFVGDAAHELRTPLAILRGEVEAIPDQWLRSTLLADIDNMTQIVNQLIETAESETLAIRPGEVADLQAVAVEVAAFMAPIALAEDKAIAVLGEDVPVRVAGNAGALFRAVRNLVENAIRHTPTGTTVEIEPRPDGSIAVSDAGPGIPHAERDLVFQRFWRGDRRHAGSAGLGLAIVARIVAAHGGRIGVADAPAGGAVISIAVPLAPPPPA